MDISEILSKVDHTLLSQNATWDDIKTVCDDGIRYKTASVCIPPSFVKLAKRYVGDQIRICTVIGFPNGYSTTETKCFETADAVKNGADEIDLVVNIGHIKDAKYDEILDEINRVKAVCDGNILKVIIETCLLIDDEKIKMCGIVSRSNADYIKTSTGFSSGGATVHDIELFGKYTDNSTKIKAAGGISTLEDAQRFIDLGASRLGTSRIVKIIKSQKEENGYVSSISDTSY